MRYQLKKHPEKFFGVSMKLCRLVKEGKELCFFPTRRANSLKLDTESQEVTLRCRNKFYHFPVLQIWSRSGKLW